VIDATTRQLATRLGAARALRSARAVFWRCAATAASTSADHGVGDVQGPRRGQGQGVEDGARRPWDPLLRVQGLLNTNANPAAGYEMVSARVAGRREAGLG